MKMLARPMRFACVPALLLALTGCSGRDRSPESSIDPQQLEMLNLGPLPYSAQNNKGGSLADDLKPHLESQNFDPEPLLAKIRSGDIIVPWNVNLNYLFRVPGGIDSFVIVYEKDTPTRGGYIVQGLEHARKVTADEFKTLKL